LRRPGTVGRTDVSGGEDLVARSDVKDQTDGRVARQRSLRTFAGRHRKATITAAILLVGLVVFVLVWFQPQQAFLNTTVEETLPSAGPAASPSPGGSTSSPGSGQSSVLASGRFRSLEHDTSGRALLVRLADGRVLLRFEDLDTLNGPDLRVYLSEVPAGGDAHAYGEDFVDLGQLKGNKGNQNYLVPKDVDVTRFKSAVIWCRRFTVGFGVAPLSAPSF
ncbi:MAG TPA: DM13 domain-containing protein, partial [Actinomycetota bacterium]|nr:DM13 domain-containing protein [Actinomycetota bacterium]